VKKKKSLLLRGEILDLANQIALFALVFWWSFGGLLVVFWWSLFLSQKKQSW